MRVCVDREQLLTELGWVERAGSSKGPVETSRYVHLRAHDDRLELTASDYETTLQVRLSTAVEQEGVAWMPIRMLALIRSLAGNEVEISAGPDFASRDCIGIASGAFKSSFWTPPPPMVSPFDKPLTQPGQELTIPASVLEAVVSQVGIAMPTEDGEFKASYVRMLADGELLEFVATDGYRLGYLRINDGARYGSFIADVPRRTVGFLGKLALDGYVRVCAGASEASSNVAIKYVEFHAGSRSVIAKQPRGAAKFPDYRKVLGSLGARDRWKATVESVSLANLCARAAIITNPRRKGVRTEVEDQRLGMTIAVPDMDFSSEIPCDWTSDTARVFGINERYLQEGVGACGSGKLALMIGPDDRSIVCLQPVDGPAGQEYSYLVMPMKLDD